MARVGKIARLPSALREEINLRLAEGSPGSQILEWLNVHPDVITTLADQFGGAPITDQNLSEWRRGGYAEWCARRDRIQHLGDLSRWSVKAAEAAGGSLATGAAAIVSGQILEVLEGLDALKDSGEEGNESGDAKANLAVIAQSLEGLTLSLSRLRKGDHTAEALRIARERLAQTGEALALERAKFQRLTCELFIRWAEDGRASAIAADGGLPQATKIERLGELIFGEDWHGPSEAQNGGEKA